MKDVLIGMVLGMMMIGVVSQTTFTPKTYTVDVDKEKVDYLSGNQKKSG